MGNWKGGCTIDYQSDLSLGEEDKRKHPRVLSSLEWCIMSSVGTWAKVLSVPTGSLDTQEWVCLSVSVMILVAGTLKSIIHLGQEVLGSFTMFSRLNLFAIRQVAGSKGIRPVGLSPIPKHPDKCDQKPGGARHKALTPALFSISLRATEPAQTSQGTLALPQRAGESPCQRQLIATQHTALPLL
jgi:hypothetical protein